MAALSSKFVSFHESLITSAKFPVRFLANLVANDLRTVQRRNFSAIQRLYKMKGTITVDQLNPRFVKKNVCYREIPETEKWRVGLGKELLSLGEENVEIPGFTSDEEEYLLHYICTT